MTHSAKQDFGDFVAEHRRGTGRTQRELASMLHVTESAVSKWERGLSYPDISLLPALARELDVGVQELVRASEDHEGRADRRDAESYREWRSAVLWTTLIAYAIAIVTCFIVNLSVAHALTWFWVVLPAVALAFSLTTLPLLRIPHPGWSSLGASTVSLLALLLVVWLGSGQGSWLLIAVSGVLLAIVLVFTPIWLSLPAVPAAVRQLNVLLTLVVGTVAILLFLLILLAALGRADRWATVAVPIAAIALIPVWIAALVIRYLPLNGLGIAAIVTAIGAVATLVLDPAITSILGEPAPLPADLSRWQSDTIDANVLFLVVAGLVVVSAALGVASVVQARITRAEARALRTPSGRV
ncbi:helix-turn-helix domain-containing protein [Microbacterium sp. PF5]|uniref:helix-turn-helix domain-containing protein n=1 Tax=Microbacterium sp. PF5 TaxID=2305435 RepID=UPI00197BA3D3|nr:helix-turn-helix transcriptional regulator [Microbacterium sp. PF5]